MRVDLNAHIPPHPYQGFGSVPLVLTIKSAIGIPGQSEYRTTAPELLRMLDKRTDINSAVLDRFKQSLTQAKDARMRNVDLSEEVLTTLGFFID